MKNFIKLTALTLFILGIAACGRTGDLERVKTSSTTPSITHTA
ncbi:MAG: hypothetical protein Ctma_0814 [Catillopecten margaritatus gill symbiont]|uniref:Lipoprotein n=1 Tax=Catillopecten margaritatus gill symbiont TaxID=3083288 RepID=A0AAU6PGI4_9GAMM